MQYDCDRKGSMITLQRINLKEAPSSLKRVYKQAMLIYFKNLPENIIFQ